MFRLICALVCSMLVVGLGATAIEAADYSCTNCLVDVSAGEAHTCAMREDTSLTCWGYDFFAQTQVPSLERTHFDFAQVSAGGYHTCAVLACNPPPGFLCPIGNVRCWGDDSEGQASPGSNQLVQVSAGRYHTCGLEADNDVVCWGADDSGQSTPPILIDYQFIEVAAGGYHTCGLIECAQPICAWRPNVSCWGLNGWGQSSVVGLPADFIQVSAGWYHTCGLREGGEVECWGRDDYGQATPPPGILFQQVSASGNHTCGLRPDGRVMCWGLDNFNQSSPPKGAFEQISSGAGHACAVGADGSVTCWGNDIQNQTVPTAGLCGLFREDLEIGGDCRWSNGSTPCWSADCDGDGYAAPDAESYCQPAMPAAAPATCPSGGWTDVPPGCGGYDCMDGNPLVFTGQDQSFSDPYNPGGQKEDRFDFNCDGVEEKMFGNFSTDVCCATVGGPCIAATGPGCDLPGWDTATVSEIPACGETGDYLLCAMINESCVEYVVPGTQYCR